MKVLLLLTVLFLSSCSSLPKHGERNDLADYLAQQSGWHKEIFHTDPFALAAYTPIKNQFGEHLTIYIEGDGYSWVSASQPSLNPTPVNPIGLKLALAHVDGNAAYIARPCQYLDIHDSNCQRIIWTNKRFAPEVIESSNNAVETLKKRFKAKYLTIVGYSGGGAVAALLAARRRDVVRLVTIAGNLDHNAWAKHHKVNPLSGSLNPVDVRAALASIPQIHFVGMEDMIMPPKITKGFVSGLPRYSETNVVVIPEYNHHCCWDKNWKYLWAKFVSNQNQ